MTETPVVRRLFERHDEAVRSLRQQVPELFDLVRGHAPVEDEREAWATFSASPVVSCLDNTRPTLVAVLAGPSGAGKSTLFTLLTGIPVPAGNDVRPMSRSSALAVPSGLLDAQRLPELLPGYRFERLKNPERLRERDVAGDTVFYDAYSAPPPDAEVALILADIPDFNTVERSNWEKAERMIHRADVVLFTVYSEGYKDERTIAILRRCCRSAGYLACVFTKTTPRAAERIWADLKAYVATDDAFSDTRHDGCTLADFLARAPAYASPYRETPGMDDLVPIGDDAPGFVSLLWGLKGAAILLERRSQAVREGVRAARALCDVADRRADTLAEGIAETDRSIDREAECIAGAQFPIGRMLKLIIETANETRPLWLRRISLPVSTMAKGILLAGGRLRRLFDQVRAKAIRKEVTDRDLDSLEQERLAERMERLLDHWRNVFPEERAGRLSPDACRTSREAVLSRALPREDTTWDHHVKDRFRDWINERPLRKRLMPLAAVTNDLLVVLGGAAAVIDYTLVGGLGTTGILTAAAGGSLLSGLLLKVFEEFNLRGHLVEADREWRELRKRRIADHLREHLADPMLRADWSREHTRLSQLGPACRRTCGELEHLGKELSNV